MEEPFLILLGLAVAGFAIVSIAVAWIAFVRASAVAGLTRRIADLERAVGRLIAQPRVERTVEREPEPLFEPAPPPRAPGPIPWTPAPPAPLEPRIAAASAPPPITPVPQAAPPTAREPIASPPPLRVEPPTPRAIETPRAAAAVSKPVATAAGLGIDWERWLGIRGAAWLGGFVLAFAGLLFFQYSIQRGWITPAFRCSIGAVFGVACVVASVFLRKRDMRFVPDALAGAGVTTLYGATWAAQRLYELIPLPYAFGAMIAITALCIALSLRYASQPIAVFGLLGGFATPLVLSSGAEHPLGLFAYVLMLDVALLGLGRKQKWPLIATLASLATSLLFLAWLAYHGIGSDRNVELAFCAVSAGLFAAAGNASETVNRKLWIASQASSILASFAFALYFAAHADLGRHLAPIGALIALLELAAVWVAVKQRAGGLLIAAATGATATLLVWVATTQVDTALAWEAAVTIAVLAAIGHVSLEFAARRGSMLDLAVPAAASSIGMLTVAIVAAGQCSAPPLWPWLAAGAFVAILLSRQAQLGAHPALQLGAAVGLAFVFIAWRNVRTPFDTITNQSTAPLDVWIECALAAALAWVWLGVAAVRPAGRLRAWSAHAAWIVAGALLLERAQISRGPETHFISVAGAVLALIACGCGAAVMLGSPVAFGLVALAGCIAQSRDSWRELHGHPAAPTLLAMLATAWILVSALPRLASAHLGSRGSAWRIAAIACVAWMFPTGHLLMAVLHDAPDSTPLIVATVLAGAIAMSVAAHRLERVERDRLSPRAVGFAWFATIAAGLASFAFSVEVDHAVDLIGIALTLVACAALSRHLRSAPLFWLSIVCATYVALRVPVELAWTALEPTRHVRSGRPIVHWLSYVTAVPAISLLAASFVLRPGGEPSELRRRASSALALIGCLLVFVWMNAEVANHFSRDAVYDLSFARYQPRDVTLSVAWAVFALALLIIGVRTKSTAARWTSLAFFLGTSAKVFLYDLGTLTGLYRVASMIGLAFALLLVSLLYQRFVFRREPAPKVEPATAPQP